MPDPSPVPAPVGGFPSTPSLIVVAKAQAGLRTNAASIESTSRANVSQLNSILANAGAAMRPLFGRTEGRLGGALSASSAPSPEAARLASFYKVDAPADALQDLAAQLRDHAVIEAAYVKPPAFPPVWGAAAPPSLAAPPGITPDFTPRQIYLDAAPAGIDARFAWTVPGGTGVDVQIIDVEGAWRNTHEDLSQNNGGVVGGTPTADIGWRNHGTSVVGVFSGDVNGSGVTGICPDAVVRMVSIFGSDSSAAIRQAADLLNAGDILLIELHRAGPRTNFQNDPNQTGYIAVEWWPDDYAAIQYAISRGIIVVEAAGNGGEDLDAALYDTPATGFPSSWSNPFRRGSRDSGAILVGAGAPPPGTHGHDWGADRSRLWFSNYGSCVDVQGWGWEVTTTGGSHISPGDLQGGANEDEWYTDAFNGTSSASPVVVGVVGCLQGARRAAGFGALTPDEVRLYLQTTGSPQQDGKYGPATQNIGKRPDLKALIDAAVNSVINNANDGIVNPDPDTNIA